MAVPVKSSKPDTLGVAGRRSTRLTISIPISLSGKDANGHSFKENTRTIIINKHGAKIPTVHDLALGAELTVENRALGTTARANVVWLGERQDPQKPVEIGIQLTDPGNIWGIEFPPEDWQEGAPPGPGAQRGEKTAPKTSSQPTPPLSTTPPPTAATPGPRPEKAVSKPATVHDLDLNELIAGAKPPSRPPGEINAAIADFLRQADSAIEERAKAFEEKLQKLSRQIGMQTQVAIQEGANRLQEKASLSQEQTLTNFAERLEASRAQMDDMLGKFKELQASCQTEVEKTRQNIHEAGWEITQSSIEELNNKLQSELATLSTDFVEETRKRVQQEASNAVEIFSQAASGRLSKLSDEYIGRLQPEISARQTEATEEVRKQAQQFVQRATQDLQAAAARINSQLSPAVQSGEEALVKLGQATARIEEAVQKGLEKSAQKIQDQVSQEMALQAQKAAERELEAAANDLQKQTADAKVLLTEELEDYGRGVIATTKGELDTLTHSTAASLHEAGNASLAEFRDGLQRTVGEYQEKFAPELEAKLRELSSNLGRHMVEQLQTEAVGAADRATAQIGERVDARVKEASDAVKLHVGSGAVFLQELQEKGETNLKGQLAQIDAASDAAIEKIRSQIDGFAQSIQEQLTKESQSVVQEFRTQLERAAQLMHHHSLEEIGASLQEAIDRLVEQAATQLTAQAQENIAVIAERLEERKEIVVNEAEEALRMKLAQVFAAILEPGSRKTTLHEPAETEDARKPR